MTLRALLQQIDDPRRDTILAIYDEHEDLFKTNPGSTSIHQAWPGGLADHLADMMRLADLEYAMLNEYLRPRGETLPFTLASAKIVIFCHDAEKLYVYAPDHLLAKSVIGLAQLQWGKPVGDPREKAFKEYLKDFALGHWIYHYRLFLTAPEANAIKYTHGEGDDYRNDRRVMNELAAFVGNIDRTSARILYASGKGLGHIAYA